MLAKLSLSIEHSAWIEGVRKIPCEIASRSQVVSRGADIAFEYWRDGGCVFRKIRQEVVEDGEVGKKFWIDPPPSQLGTGLFLWNEPCLSEPCSPDVPLIITEGEFDALSFLTAGATHVVSVPNGNPNKPSEGDINPLEDTQFKYLWQGAQVRPDIAKFNKIILATDNDKVGLILRDELAVRLGRPKCWYVTYPEGCKDANDVLVKYGSDVLSDLVADAKPIVPSRLVPFSEIPTRADAKPYGTGWSEFDNHFRMLPPQLIVVTGKPNAGKSQWALALVANWARIYGLKGAILQFEDDPDRNRRDLIRYATAWKKPDLGEAKGVVIRDEPEVWVDRMFRSISPNEDLDEANDYDLNWLRATIEEAAIRHGAKWIIIDPWNEIEHLWGRQDTEATYLNRALKQLKRIARRYQIALIVVTHPTKEGANKTSVEDFTLSDINGGQVWSNKADLGVVVWADDVTKPLRHIKVAKSKNFLRYGMPGIVRKEFLTNSATYTFVGRGIS